MAEYFKIKKLGEGTYATIYLAKEITSESTKFTTVDPGETYRRLVAIKKIKITPHGHGIEINALREIRALKLFNHPNIVSMYDIFIHKMNIHIVLEYVEFTLDQFIKCKDIILMPSDIKSWVFMLLSGLKVMHDNYIIHRDLKLNNLLVSNDGTLKIADFGLSRKITEIMTPDATTRWYRAPEMLLGLNQYTMASDIWSVGVIMAEMFLRMPFFIADTDIQQLETICKILGTPQNYDLFDQKTSILKMKIYPPTNLKLIFTAISDDALDLLQSCLQFNPRDRISITDALNHRYFQTLPVPTPIGKLPTINKTQ